MFRVTFDHAFRDTIKACAELRRDGNGTWLTSQMIEAYCRLHDLGLAHSVEAWLGDKLVGGLYGVALGRVFFGESMFSRATDASKVAFATLVIQLQQWGFTLIDCQVQSQHLRSLGAEDIPRSDFIQLLSHWGNMPGRSNLWELTLNAGQLSEWLNNDKLM